MATASGFILLLLQDRMTKFLECVAEGRAFSEPVGDFQHSRTTPLVCFVVNKGKLTHIGFGRRGVRAGTDLRRLNIEQVEEIFQPVSIRKILNRLPKRYVISVHKRFELGGLLTEKGFSAVVETIRQFAPQVLNRFSKQRMKHIQKLSDKARGNLAKQKEALLTALSITGIDRRIVQEWTPKDEKPSSFLDGLPNARAREDQMVINDLSKLPGFSSMRNGVDITGRALFESPKTGERLTIILANRLPLEEQTGTDLIYFNETYQSFIMVQYKVMECVLLKDGRSVHCYRLPNAQLQEEIRRMDVVLDRMKAYMPNIDINGFRLTDNPFFLKLCPRIVFNPDDVGLVRGMYFPLDYWKLLERAPRIKGVRGGLRITYDNAKRYFDNTAFITAVSKAWIGTTPSQSQVLKNVIRTVVETGKAVAIAIKSKSSFDSRDEDMADEQIAND